MNFNFAPSAPAVNITGSSGTIFTSFYAVIAIVLFVFIGLVVWYATIGYTIDLGWSRLLKMLLNKDNIDVEIGPGIHSSLRPDTSAGSSSGNNSDSSSGNNSDYSNGNGSDYSNGNGSDSSNGNGSDSSNDSDNTSGSSTGTGRRRSRSDMIGEPPRADLPDVEDRANGMPGAVMDDTSLFSFLNPKKGKDRAVPIGHDVFNVSRNIYTFHDAPAVCAALGGELATYEQVQDAYEKGADWCNYGWAKGQMAVFPTQKETYQKLQKGSPDYHNACGRPGINGGYFDNPELLFGVNCVGKRPTQKSADEMRENDVSFPKTADEIEFDKKVQKFRDQMDTLAVLPFNKQSWSG